MVDTQAVKEIKVVVFRLQDDEYGVDVQQVRSIERTLPLTHIPNSPDFIMGVIHLRGSVLPVIDLRSRFHMPEHAPSEHARLIIVNVHGMDVALLVDSANEVIDIPVASIAPPPAIFAGIHGSYLRGVAKLTDRLLVLLNLDQILDPQELEQLQQMERSE